MPCKLLFCLLLVGSAAFGLTQVELSLLRDPGGWEYQTITDPGNGFQTQADCFVKQYTGQCRGSLIFRSDGTFRQDITAHAKSQHRGGRYQISGDQITFWDEHDEPDGPYAIAIDQAAKTLHLTRSGIDMLLMLKSEVSKRLASPKK